MTRSRCRFQENRNNQDQPSKSSSGLSVLIFGVILLFIGLLTWFFTTHNQNDHKSLLWSSYESDSNHMKIMHSIAMVMIAFGAGLIIAGIVVAICGAVKSKDKIPQEMGRTPYTIGAESIRASAHIETQTSGQPVEPPPPPYQPVMAEENDGNTGQPIVSGYQIETAHNNPSAPPREYLSRQQMLPWNENGQQQPWIDNGQQQQPPNLFNTGSGYNTGGPFSGRPIYRHLEPLPINASYASSGNIFTVSGQSHVQELEQSVQILPGQFQSPYDMGESYDGQNFSEGMKKGSKRF